MDKHEKLTPRFGGEMEKAVIERERDRDRVEDVAFRRRVG